MGVRIVTDSAASISDADRTRLHIEVVPIHVTVDGHPVPEAELLDPDFHVRLAGMTQMPRTSQPSPEEFAEAFRKILDAGDDVLAVLISAGMSGTVQSAEVAAAEVRTQRPGARIEVVDSRSNSLEEGFVLLSAAEAALEGETLEGCARIARETTRRTRFLFTPQSLEYLRRGGRISGAKGLLGVMLRIAPILTAEKGLTGVAAVARNPHYARTKIGLLMRNDVEKCGLLRVGVQFFGEQETARAFAEEVVAPIAGMEVPVLPIHPVVGLHVGPAMGVAYETERPLR